MSPLRFALIGASLAGATLSFAAPDRFVLFDHVFKHTGARQLYEDWNFDTRKKFNPDAPLNWLEGAKPILDYGIYVCRVEVVRMERGWKTPPHVQFGWWNFPKEVDPSIRHIAAPPILLTNLEPPASGSSWVYEYVGTLRSLDVSCIYYGMGPKAALPGRVTDWDWRHAYTADTAYTLFNPRDNRFDADGDGKISEAEYPDIEFRMTLTVIMPDSPDYAKYAGNLSPFVGWRAKSPLPPAQ